MAQDAMHYLKLLIGEQFVERATLAAQCDHLREQIDVLKADLQHPRRVPWTVSTTTASRLDQPEKETTG
jgi:hypothetical protein